MLFWHIIKKNNKNVSFSNNDITKILKFIKIVNTGNLVISGGGDPFFVIEKLEKIIDGTEVDLITIISSGFWASNLIKTERIIKKVYDANKNKKKESRLSLRISIDEFHEKKIPLQNIFNIIQVFQNKYRDNEFFSFFLHSFFSDKAIEKLLIGLPIKERVKKSQSITEIILENGFLFKIEFSELVYPDLKVDLNNRDIIKRNVTIFDKRSYRKRYKNGKIITGICKDISGKNGFDYLVNYNGEIELWGSTPTDSIATIWDKRLIKTNERLLKDVVTLSMIEKGVLYLESILKEVDSKAIIRAKSVNITDYFTRLALEDEKVRLYYSIRVIQDFVKENRISIEKLPGQIKSLVLLDRIDLIKLYKSSKRTIIDQYLYYFKSRENHSLDSLVLLYELISLDQFDIESKEMEIILKDSKLLTRKQKIQFFQRTILTHPVLDDLIKENKENEVVFKIEKLIYWIDEEFNSQIQNNFNELEDIINLYKGIISCVQRIVEKILNGKINPTNKFRVSIKNKEEFCINKNGQFTVGICTGSFSPLHWGHIYICLVALSSLEVDFNTILLIPLKEGIEDISLTRKKDKNLLPEKLRESIIIQNIKYFEDPGLIHYSPLSFESKRKENRVEMIKKLIELNTDQKFSIGFVWGKDVIKDTKTMIKVNHWIKQLLGQYNIHGTYLLIDRIDDTYEEQIDSFISLKKLGIDIKVIKGKLNTKLHSKQLLEGKSKLMPTPGFEIFRSYQNFHTSPLKAAYSKEAKPYIVLTESEKAWIFKCNDLLENEIGVYISHYLAQKSIKFFSNGSLKRMTYLKKENGIDFDYILFSDEKSIQQMINDPRFKESLELTILNVFDIYGLKKGCLKLKKMNRADGYLYYMGDDNNKTGYRIIEVSFFEMKYSKYFYPPLFHAQRDQIIEKWGISAWSDTLEDIRLMKYILKYKIWAYKYYEGGIDGIGIEQLVIRSNETSDNGKIIIKKGDFDSTMEFIYNNGFDSKTKRIIKLYEITNQMEISDSDRNNILTFSDSVWAKLVNFAKDYLVKSHII